MESENEEKYKHLLKLPSEEDIIREFKEAAIERDATIDGTSIDELGEYDKDRVRQMFINNECSGKDIRKFGDWYVNDEGDMFYSPYKTVS